MREPRPQADAAELQLLGRKRWIYTGHFPLRYALMDGFWDRLSHSGIAQDDRIDAIMTGDTPAAHVIFVVDSVDPIGSRVQASVLTEFARAKTRAAA